MTLREFNEMSWGIHSLTIFLNGKFIVGNDILNKEYMDMTITEFNFSADDNSRITCTVDLV